MTSCIQHSSEDDVVYSDAPIVQLSVDYAKGFELIYGVNHTLVISKSIEGNTPFKDTLIFQHAADENAPTGKVVSRDPQKVVCQSSTHIAFINFLEKMKSLKGLCGKQYVESSVLNLMFQSNQTEEICNGDALVNETILNLDPDICFVYPFESEGIEELTERGVNTFMVAEYLETDPLARLEWIKLFAVIYGVEEMAQSYFEEVETDYKSLVQDEPDTTMKFIFNLPYGDSWFTPSANSLVVTLLEDAGLYYNYQNERGTENTPHSKEEIWEAGGIVPYWVIIADRPNDFTIDQLIAEEAAYGSFRSVKDGNVIFCNSRTSDYFIDGVIEPHIMLKDLLYATGKLDNHDPKYFHLLK